MSPSESSSADPVTGTPPLFKNYIGGEWIARGSQGVFDNFNPARTDDVVGTFPKSGKDEVDAAVRKAKEALKSWSATPAPHRGAILSRAGDLLTHHKEELSRLMTREMGKVLLETRGDVQEAIDTCYFFAGEGRRLYGQTTPSELPNKMAMTLRRPIGVCGLISPWNFPMAIPSWKICPALICGNTMVFKPASDTPASATRFVEILEQAGLPKGVLNLVHGSGETVGEAIISHPDVSLISFTGSTEVGRHISAKAGAALKRVSLEMGGKNCQIVMDDADLELAVEGAIWGAFGTTGQRCTATSRLIIHRMVIEEFTAKLIAGIRKLRLGDGLDEASQVGPLVNERQREKVDRFVKIGQREDKAKLLCGGGPEVIGKLKKGFFYHPTVFGECTSTMQICQEEIFGPVTCIIPIRDFEEAIAVANNVRYGLSASIFTRDVNLAYRAMYELETGINYINASTIGAEVHLPFGGVKDTGNGHREGGIQALDIFSEWKTVYADFSGKLQRAQIDGN